MINDYDHLDDNISTISRILDDKMSTRICLYCNLKDVEDYIRTSKMNRNGVWATEVEIVAAASMLGADFVVYTKYGDSEKWLTYPASFSLIHPRQLFCCKISSSISNLLLNCHKAVTSFCACKNFI